jgi:tryptophanyl-tRNA synthetase
VSNLLVIHSVLSGSAIADLETEFAGRGYGDLKKAVADVVVDAVTPFRTRMTELLDDPAELDRLLARGAERASVVADATMSRIRDAVGLLPAVPAVASTRAPGVAG